MYLPDSLRWSPAALAFVAMVAVGCTRTDAPEPGATMSERVPSDDQLETYVQARYQADAEVRDSDIEVSARDGVVTLRGTVPNQQARQQAVTAAQQVDGVTSVQDLLEVESSQTADAGAPGSADKPDAARTPDDDRSPAWITTKIQAQYFVSPEIKPWNIDVTTSSNGTVTLRGEVDEAADRVAAERIAQATDGVARVNNHLRVKGEAGTAAATTPEAGDRTADSDADDNSDAWLTAKIQAKYFMDADVKGRNINVDTRDGVVTLKGEVESEAERRQAVALARNTDGVRSITDELQTRAASTADAGDTADTRDAVTAIDDAWVTTKIQSQFYLDEDIKGRDIDVDTRNGIVTLKGVVASDVERQAAQTIAQETDGVQRVNNQLKVEATGAR